MRFVKKIVAIILLLAVTAGVSAQVQNPVSWLFAAKKINSKTYEVTLTANVNNGWHIYSQFTPDGGPVPTAITFTKNPLLVLDGAVIETGKLEQKHEPLFGVDVKQFSGKVIFTQKVTLKAPVKTKLAGSIEFMLCNDRQCLPPAEKQFSIALN
jgi:thiol:disulfide interchange protein DsbD